MEFSIHDDMTQNEADYVEEKLVEFADQFMGPRNNREFGLVLRNAKGDALGGVIGNTLWDWIQIGTLWIAEEFRGKGLGHQLLERAEELGRQRGCKFARISTWEFEARDFYEAHGYAVFGKHNDFPKGHTQYYLAKEL